MTVRRLVIGISGASGAIYGIRLLELLQQDPDVQTHLVMSSSAKRTIVLETNWSIAKVEALADEVHSSKDIAANISSGSYRTDGMVIAPCTMKTLSGVVHSYADNLLTRAADVVLKEGRKLVLMPREVPLHAGHCKLLHEAALMGIHIAPPMPAFYNQPKTIDDLINHSLGRVLDLFGMDLGIVERWAGAQNQNVSSLR
jgi:4-hydroxy-3-polyprenylbenzoate decarboxylase